MVSTSQHHQALELALAGKIPEAEAIFRQLLAHDPNDAEALHFFGVLATRKGEHAEAERNFRQALETQPTWAKAWHSLGAALHAQGRLEEAADAIGEAVRLEPKSDVWQLTYSVVLRAVGRLADAANALKVVIDAKPQSAEAYGLLGEILKDMSRYEEAEDACRKAISLDPNLAEAHNNLGNALHRMHRADAAEAAYRKAIEIKSDRGNFHANLANVLWERGRLDEAEKEYRHAVALEPTNTAPYFMLAELGALGVEDPIFDRIGKFINSDAVPGPNKIDLHFAAARVLEANGDFDGAFANWKSGNALKNSMLRWDNAARDDLTERIRTVFDKDLLARHAGHGSASDTPIFVLGMPRSGTTLVEQILASHSEVDGGGELPVLRRLADEIGFPEKCGELASDALSELGQRYLNEARPGHLARFTDKMPGNCFRIGLIRLLLPNARIVHCRRDPVDTCLSCYRTQFRGGLHGYSYDLTNLGLEYRRYQRIMDHWTALMPDAIHEVRYESLIANTEQEIRRLLDFCGLSFEAACLNFHETDRVVETASAGQVRQEIYGTAVERWKKYEKHLQPLFDALETR